jgi:hypothetical protein
MIFPFFMAIHWNLWDILSPYVPIVMDINPLNPHRFWKKNIYITSPLYPIVLISMYIHYIYIHYVNPLYPYLSTQNIHLHISPSGYGHVIGTKNLWNFRAISVERKYLMEYW